MASKWEIERQSECYKDEIRYRLNDLRLIDIKMKDMKISYTNEVEKRKSQNCSDKDPNIRYWKCKGCTIEFPIIGFHVPDTCAFCYDYLINISVMKTDRKTDIHYMLARRRARREGRDWIEVLLEDCSRRITENNIKIAMKNKKNEQIETN